MNNKIKKYRFFPFRALVLKRNYGIPFSAYCISPVIFMSSFYTFLSRPFSCFTTVPHFKRSMSTFLDTESLSSRPVLQELSLMTLWFLTGFTNAEGCFYISITKNSEFKTG